jgi:lipid-A-disaccharide synthase-like uncharacterized protein
MRVYAYIQSKGTATRVLLTALPSELYITPRIPVLAWKFCLLVSQRKLFYVLTAPKMQNLVEGKTK